MTCRALSRCTRVSTRIWACATSVRPWRRCARCPSSGGVGALGYCLGGKLAYLAACRCDVDVAVGYYGVGIENNLEEASRLRGRLVLHIAERDGFCPPEARERILAALGGKPGVELYVYPGLDHAFARTGGAHYDKPAAMMAHQRSMAAPATRDRAGVRLLASVGQALRIRIRHPRRGRHHGHHGGRALCEPHPHHDRRRGPQGAVALLPASFRQQQSARHAAGAAVSHRGRHADRRRAAVLFTHTTEIDWMLPGVPPTGKYVEIPLVAIVKFRGDKLYHEHIYWDQASVLVQVGLLDPQGLPVAGAETARKLLDETLPSNTLMARWRRARTSRRWTWHTAKSNWPRWCAATACTVASIPIRRSSIWRWSASMAAPGSTWDMKARCPGRATITPRAWATRTC